MPDISLIANSGIQFFSTRLVIDTNSGTRSYFHEWFDEEAVQTSVEPAFLLKEHEMFVRLADLADCGFLSPEGKLAVAEEQVLANPNIRALHTGSLEDATDLFSLRLFDRHGHTASFFNVWLPLPFFELDTLGAFKYGPYNWCRGKLVPRGEPTDGKLTADLLLAFDTRALYDEEEKDKECPSFVSASEREKRFRLCADPLMLTDFCSGRNEWVRAYLMHIAHGVSDMEELRNRLGEGHRLYAFLASYFLLVEHLARLGAAPDVRLLRNRGVDAIGVEMIVDIGNSRTSAILFENSDFTKVQSLRLQNLTFPLLDDGSLNRVDEAFDMRLAFRKVSFADGPTLGGSRQFVWPSLVRLGTEAEYLTHETVNLAEGDEILSTYSSPKRYLWDAKPRREEWRCVRTKGEKLNAEPIIEGLSNYLNNDGTVNAEGLGFGLHFSRRSLMTLAFLEIVSQADTYVNSPEYRLFNGRSSQPRHIGKIILTCPTAMSHSEQHALHDALRDALDVLGKFNRGKDETYVPAGVKIVPADRRPGSDDAPGWIYDEATCSQFVYLYGQFSEKYAGCSREFFKTYGRLRPTPKGERDSLVVGSLDIGAGTSDIMICRYEYDAANPTRLKPVPLFWDSFDYAGDDMMKVLIENILLQGENGILEREMARRGLEREEIYARLYQLFGTDHNRLSFHDRMTRRDINLQVLVPVMSHFLGLLSRHERYREVPFEEIFAKNPPSAPILDSFREHFGFGLEEVRWTYDSEIMARNIELTMNDLLESVATIMHAYGCDLVLLSGRPSSLSPIRRIFLKYFAGEPHRLIALNEFRIGRWYPFADRNGYLTNSKSVVPVGAMIGYRASSTGGLGNFSLDLTELAMRLKPTTDFFVVRDRSVLTGRPFITPQSNTGKIPVNAFPVYIGTKQFDLSNYPVRPFYVLDLNRDALTAALRKKHAAEGHDLNERETQLLTDDAVDRLLQRGPFTFTLEREAPGEDKEQLVVASVADALGEEAEARFFSLTVQSLNDPDCYWLDSGEFNINIAASH